MFDFCWIDFRNTKSGVEVVPKFTINYRCSDLMIQGGDFYAVWNEETGMWSTHEQTVIDKIDKELYSAAVNKYGSIEGVRCLYMKDSDSGSIDRWHKYVKQQMREKYHPLDETFTFLSQKTVKEDYASKRLSYDLGGDCPAYTRLMNGLYDPEELQKLEWMTGAILTGDSKHIQKFGVLYGPPSSGKGTWLNEVLMPLTKGYYAIIKVADFGNPSKPFATEPLSSDPLVAIETDGNLSRIEDNTILNTLVSHEELLVNEKFKPQHPIKSNAFIILGTNSPVRITDAKSGLIRRLIDVYPSGRKFDYDEYMRLTSQLKFEYGGIAQHCIDVYKSMGEDYYQSYIPIRMMKATNEFYSFMEYIYDDVVEREGVSLNELYKLYKEYCDFAGVQTVARRRVIAEEARAYFREFYDDTHTKDGRHVRNWYTGLRTDRFGQTEGGDSVEQSGTDSGDDSVSGCPDVTKRLIPEWLNLKEQDSIFDTMFANCLVNFWDAKNSRLERQWSNVTTTLSQIDSHQEHFVKVPESLIVIDFDIRGPNDEKCLEKNLEAAARWPETYTEVSKSGGGIHLHYFYNGDVTKLSSLYDVNIEVKTFTGGSSLRRRLSLCNNSQIATISSGLAQKGGKNVIDWDGVKSDKHLYAMIMKDLKKQSSGGHTVTCVSHIVKVVKEAYDSGLSYDIRPMQNAIISFAASSTNQSENCLSMIADIPWCSDDKLDNRDIEINKDDGYIDERLVFFDCEVFPNLFFIGWCFENSDTVVRMFNPTPEEVEDLFRYKLVGFNNRAYDNHIMYARTMGYSNYDLYKLSQMLVSHEKGGTYDISERPTFGAAYNISYTDIYDFASAANKKSLKKLEYEMGVRHKELGLPWDLPVPEERWEEVAKYCENDVLATKAAFYYLASDWVTREILATWAGKTVNDTTNNLTQQIIFGDDKHPQKEFLYRDLSQPVMDLDPEVIEFLKEACPEMMAKRHGEAGSLLPYFPGYKHFWEKVPYKNAKGYKTVEKSVYRGEEVGEGGEVVSDPGIWYNVALLDIASMHPHSTIAECLLGVKYTRRFRHIVEGRVAIKHKDWDGAREMIGDLIDLCMDDINSGKFTNKDLATGLKTPINAFYGLSDAKFNNRCRDERNVDNIVAKRGALFMVDLMYAVRERGFTVAHIKTDSIKIPNATPEIIKFVYDFGKRYGYTFEHEATYEKMCLVNDAVYVAKYASKDWCQDTYGYIPEKNYDHEEEWTATGTQFQIPFVFKTLFSHEEITFDDMCEIKSVKTAIFLDKNEGLGPDRHNYIFVGRVGQFCPIKPGCGGAEMLRDAGDGKYAAVTGTKGYRWLESVDVLTLGKEDDIDVGYYRNLVDDARDTISKYGDFESFVSDDPAPAIFGDERVILINK